MDEWEPSPLSNSASLPGTHWQANHCFAMLQLANELRFLGTFLVKPLRVASPFPSGRRLAKTIAAQIERTDEAILELGPGTGSVTAAILAQGAHPSRLVAIESDPNFAQFLRERFSEAHILEGDAFALEHVLRKAGYNEPFGAIVCGVPVLTQPMRARETLLSTAIRWLRPGSPFIQFSYGARPPIPPNDQIGVQQAETVWQNIVPIHIWVYRGNA